MKEIDQAQVEQLKKIGEYLSQERQTRSVALEEVAVKTYIPLRLLQALEQGQIERLPEPVFVQGFIRRYADVIGLDGPSLAKTFEFDASPAPVKLLEPEVVTPTPPPVQEANGGALDRSPEPQPSNPIPLIALLGGGAVVLLGIAVVSLFSALGSGNSKKPAVTANQSLQALPGGTASKPKPKSQASASPKPQASTSPKPQASASSTEAPPSPKPQASEAPITAVATTAPASTAPVQVVVELTDSSWMEIIVDGKSQYEGLLKKGYKKTWSAKKTVTLRSGNAGGVQASYNQGEAKTLGARGEVKEVTYSADQSSTAQPN